MRRARGVSPSKITHKVYIDRFINLVRNSSDEFTYATDYTIVEYLRDVMDLKEDKAGYYIEVTIGFKKKGT